MEQILILPFLTVSVAIDASNIYIDFKQSKLGNSPLNSMITRLDNEYRRRHGTEINNYDNIIYKYVYNKPDKDYNEIRKNIEDIFYVMNWSEKKIKKKSISDK